MWLPQGESGAGLTPLGGSMALLLLLLGHAGSGLFANDEILVAGPLSGWVTGALSNWFWTWQARLGDLLKGARVLHVAAAPSVVLALAPEPLERWRLSGRACF